jgi:predicted glycoside hydrolase/deacetylase ChbG (UPF0249 family)
MNKAPATRTVVIHHDDLGGSHSANAAFVELFDLGIVTCGSVMVPCPWFPEIAAIARERPDLDIGVHLTLTAEFPGFRWRPLTGVKQNGLTDGDGFCWRSVAEARRADPQAVELELRAQIETALDAGIDVTHLDAHMGTAWQPEFLEIYIRLGEQFRLPIALTRDVGKMAPADADFEPAFERLAERGNPDFQRFLTTPFGNLAPDESSYAAIFGAAAPGLNWAGFHFTAPGDFAMISEDAPTRLAEYELFRSGRARTLIDAAGLELAGMRSLRDAMRGSLVPGVDRAGQSVRLGE